MSLCGSTSLHPSILGSIPYTYRARPASDILWNSLGKGLDYHVPMTISQHIRKIPDLSNQTPLSVILISDLGDPVQSGLSEDTETPLSEATWFYNH